MLNPEIKEDKINSPTPEQIKTARVKIQADLGLGITAAQKYCAELIYKGLRTWQQWESSEGTKDHRKMDRAFWELFVIKVAQATRK